MGSKWLVVFLLLAGCGEASWNPDLKTSDALAPGTPFVQALETHGCPDSVQEIDSETFTVTWDRSKTVALAPLFSHRERASLSYPVRKGKLGPAWTSGASSNGIGVGFGADASGSLRSTAGTFALIPLVLVIAGWQIGRRLRERVRPELLPLALVSLLLLGTSWGSEHTGTSSPGGVAAGSPVGQLVNELGPQTRTVALPDEIGRLLVYESRDTKHVVVGGSVAETRQGYLVQRGRVVSASPKTSSLVAQYYLFPFFETAEARLHAAIAWSTALGTLALALGSRGKRPAPAPPS